MVTDELLLPQRWDEIQTAETVHRRSVEATIVHKRMRAMQLRLTVLILGLHLKLSSSSKPRAETDSTCCSETTLR